MVLVLTRNCQDSKPEEAIAIQYTVVFFSLSVKLAYQLKVHLQLSIEDPRDYVQFKNIMVPKCVLASVYLSQLN
jgi:hypothetical protein